MMEVVTKITRRKVFDLNNFLYDLNYSLEEQPIMIDDTVQRYKDFLSHTSEPLLSNVKKYVDNHCLVVDNERVKSFILACHRPKLEK